MKASKQSLSFKRSVPGVAAGIVGLVKGKVPDLKFSFTGPPRTDGHTIYTGDLPLNADDELIALLWGHSLHEIGHILHTSFDRLKSVLPHETVLFKQTHNSIEDVYLERRLTETFRGARRWLSRSLEIMDLKGHIRSGADSSTDALLCFPLFWGSVHINGFEILASTLVANREALVNALNENGVCRLEALLDQRLETVNSTAEALELTQDYLDLARDIEQEKEEEEKDEDESDDSNSDSAGGGDSPSDDDSNGDDSCESDSPQQPDGSDASQGADGSDQGDDDNTAASPSVFDNEDHPDLDHDPIDSTRALEEVSEENKQDNASAGDNLGAGGACEFSGKMERPGNGDIARFETLRQESSGVTNALANRLVRLMAKARSSRRVTGTRGRLHVSRVHRLFVGSERIYRRQHVGDVPQSCVSIVTDLSGSMCGSGERTASVVLIALAEALTKARIAFEATAFGDDFWVAKGFDDPYSSCRPYFGGLDQAVSGTTPLGESMHEAAMRLVRRPEPRKIMICLTDGLPDNPGLVSDVDQKLRATGADVLGIGIGSHAVSHVFARSVVVNDLSDLGPQLLNELTPRLLAIAS